MSRNQQVEKASWLLAVLQLACTSVKLSGRITGLFSLFNLFKKLHMLMRTGSGYLASRECLPAQMFASGGVRLRAGAGNVDDDGFQRQGRGSGKAWGPAGKGDSSAARPNAWAQGSSSVRVSTSSNFLLPRLSCICDNCSLTSCWDLTLSQQPLR